MVERLCREPIYSVQQQVSFPAKQPGRLICKSSRSDGCYRNYLEKNLPLGFGQLREVEYETAESSRPSMVILFPSLDIDEAELTERTNQMASSLEETGECRKRYAIVHGDHHSYLIGGYVFDPEQRTRRPPEHDYKYEHKTKRLETISPLPHGLISFGLAAGNALVYCCGLDSAPLDGNCLVAIGGHTLSYVRDEAFDRQICAVISGTDHLHDAT